MATKVCTIKYDPSASLKLAVFRVSDGYVLDFNDHTFKSTVGGATTPYSSATELTVPGGSADSLYTVSLDLSHLNSSSTEADYLLDWYTDTGLTTCVSSGEQITVASSAQYLYGNVSANVTQIASATGAASALGNVYNSVKSLTVDTGTFSSTTTVFETTNSTNADYYTDRILYFYGTPSGNAAGSLHRVTNYTYSGNSKVKLTITPALPAAPANGATIAVLGYASSSSLSGSDLTDITDAVVAAVEGAYRCRVEAAVTSAAGTELRILAWLELGGEVVALPSGTCSIVVREHGSGANLFTVTDNAPNAQGIFELTQSTPGFTDDRLYGFMTTIVDDGAVSHTSYEAFPVIG